MDIAFLFVLGLLIGSFLNVVTLRYTPGSRLLNVKIIGGRSHCRSCGTVLKWYELIPLISFLIQGRKCRHCAETIALQYPMVELAAGVLTAALPLYFYRFFDVAFALGQSQSVLWYYLLSALWIVTIYVFIVITIIDLRYTIIPDMSNLLLVFLGLGVVGVKYFFGNFFAHSGSFLGSYASIFGFADYGVWAQALIAAALGALFFGGIIGLTRGRGMGLGDLKLIIPLGLLLGWPDLLLAIMLSFVVGSLFSLGLLIRREKTMKDGIPFGPFLVIGVLLTIFWGQSIAGWYFSII